MKENKFVTTELLRDYARLVIRTGVALQEDQTLVINAPISCAEFARLLVSEGYSAGAHDVHVVWSDEETALVKYLQAKPEVFDEFAPWRQLMYTETAQKGAAYVSIHADNPEIFKDVEPERLQRAQRAAGAALLEYRMRLMSNKNRWCIVSIPTEAWAKKVFPELGTEEAVGALWQEILAAVRVQEGQSAVERWQEHTAFLARAAKFMNDNRFAALHYQNSLGTDLTIRLPEGHIWAGGAEDAADGVSFVANMPTEEVYTMPHREGVDGTVVATKPLHYHGNLIEGFRLTFKEGKVVDWSAAKGGELLQELLDTDEGSAYLGEVALVPFDSPISQSGVLFYNTLFDENASCHLALGKAYPTCIAGGTEQEQDELLARGVNDSIVHEDFMIGSRDLTITGITQDGKEVPVFSGGNFVSFDE